jgi:hypothetical protein
MSNKPTFRQLLVSVLALWRDRSHKEIGAAAGIPRKRVSLYLRRGKIPDEAFGKLLAVLECPPEAVYSMTACLELLEFLESERDLTKEEKAVIADSLLQFSRQFRQDLVAAARQSRTASDPGLPEAHATDHPMTYRM